MSEQRPEHRELTLVRRLAWMLAGTLAAGTLLAGLGMADPAYGLAGVNLDVPIASGGSLPQDVAPAHWTDVGVLGYFDPALNRKLTYADLKTDLQPLVDAGVLRRSGDSYEVIKEGAEIIGYDFPEGTNLRIMAANVQIKRNRIRAGHSTKHQGALFFQNLAPSTASDGSQSTVVVEDNEISGGRRGIYPSFRGVRLLARRNAVLANTIDPHTGRASSADIDMGDGIDWRGTFNQLDNESLASIVEQNWVGGFVNGGAGRHYDGIASVSGGNLKVLHNRIEAYGVAQTVGVRVVSDIAPIKNVWIEGNSVAGFGYSFGLGWGNPTHTETGELTNVYLRNNVSEAGTYQSGPLTGKQTDERTGEPAMFNFVREGNVCVAAKSPADLYERWRLLSGTEMVEKCNQEFGPADKPPPDPLPGVQPIGPFCSKTSDPHSFVDVGSTIFRPFIDCLVRLGITKGTSAGAYSPSERVTRGQMASFIARELDQAVLLRGDTGDTELPVHDGSSHFRDLAASDVHHANINRLARVGIVQGGVAGRDASVFGSELLVTRAQMASFLNRAHEFLTGSGMSTSSDFFRDDDGDAHEANINGIASRGIAMGDGDASFNPNDEVTRGQMAAFIIRHLSVLESDG